MIRKHSSRESVLWIISFITLTYDSLLSKTKSINCSLKEIDTYNQRIDDSTQEDNCYIFQILYELLNFYSQLLITFQKEFDLLEKTAITIPLLQYFDLSCFQVNENEELADYLYLLPKYSCFASKFADVVQRSIESFVEWTAYLLLFNFDLRSLNDSIILKLYLKS